MDARGSALARFVSGPADGLLRMVALDETGRPFSHMYLPDDDGVTRHLYGAVLGALEYQYLGSLKAARPPSY